MPALQCSEPCAYADHSCRSSELGADIAQALLQNDVSEEIRSTRKECHGWACLLATLGSLEEAAPQLHQDMQLQLLQQFPSSAYLSYQTATMCAVTVMPTRLRMSLSLLLREAGPTAPPNMQLIPVIDACIVKGDLKAGRAVLSRLASRRPLQRKRKAANMPCGALEALTIACDSSRHARRAVHMKRQHPQGWWYFVRNQWQRSCSDYGVYTISRLAVIQLAYMQLVKASSQTSTDAMHVGLSARHYSRWCKGLWLLSSADTADAMDEKDIRYFGEQLKWSGITLCTNFDEMRMMLNLGSQKHTSVPNL